MKAELENAHLVGRLCLRHACFTPDRTAADHRSADSLIIVVLVRNGASIRTVPAESAHHSPDIQLLNNLGRLLTRYSSDAVRATAKIHPL
jgi:hypothetical protein